MKLALLELSNPESTALRLLAHVAEGLVDEVARGDGPAVAERASGLVRGLEELFERVGERSRLLPWQLEVLQAQVFRGDSLEGYLGKKAWQAARLLMVPPEFEEVSEGVHPYPVLNWLHLVVGELAAGRVGAEEFGAVLEGLWQQFADGMKGLEEDEDPFRVSKAQQTCREVLGSLQDLDGFLDSGDPRVLQRGMERLLVAFERVEEVYLDGILQAAESGPTRTPIVDWLFHATCAFADELVDEGVLAAATGWGRRLVAEAACHFELECLGGAPTEVEKQVAATWKGFDQVQSALREVRRNVDAAIQLLQAGGENLHDSLELYSWLAGPAGKVPCPHCGASNRPVDRVCDRCGASLPRRYSRSEQTQREGEYVRTLLGRCEDVLGGGQVDQAFQNVVRGAFRRLAWARESLERIPHLEAVEERRTLLARGVQEYETALEALNEYLAEGKLTYLSSGIRGLMAAGKTLEQVRDGTS